MPGIKAARQIRPQERSFLRSIYFQSNISPAEVSQLRTRCVIIVQRIKNDLISLAKESGLHAFLAKTLNLEALNFKLQGLKAPYLKIIEERLSDPGLTSVARRAFILKNYIEYFSEIENGNFTLTSFEGNSEFSMATSVTRTKTSFVVLCSNGLVLRTKSSNQKTVMKNLPRINGKNGQGELTVTQNELSPEERTSFFLDQLLRNHEDNPKEPNSIYIRCSREVALILGTNYTNWRRFWFALTKDYADSFTNNRKKIVNQPRKIMRQLKRLNWVTGKKVPEAISVLSREHNTAFVAPKNQAARAAWLNAPGNSVLMRIHLSRDGYFKLLKTFQQKIDREQIEGFHKIDDRSFVAKIERGNPTFMISSLEYRREFFEGCTVLI